MDLVENDVGLDIVVTSLASDAHTWNLVFLQLVLEEAGHRVVNLGACVPDDLLVSECARHAPDLVVVSSVNGHGFHEAKRVIAKLRARPDLAATPVVVGGKLGIDGPGGQDRAAILTAAGYDAVFEDAGSIAAFRAFLGRLPVGVRS
ncbi:cobalamin B12-binding domain-containing protein [Saccharothrix sp. S26]|uniref:cobalamin B12-binding domain-containing protein n=1 Tax=Saccharothrix sp. S26 TaxID=2907215 RepID=UPI001F1CAF03|nr:cobalamin-dependent protein [Saccharothrix sp. S26]MCE6996502.1 cobalamin B12-binding domain-containing protein [Saccharothrix sp. S26]